MAENTDKDASTGRKNFFDNPVKVIEMQSEAGAAGMVHGSLLSGALTTTYTASQGLLLMIPNMYKIAGEGLPLVMNVACRTIATHALSIMGDHSDMYATRSTGFAILMSSSVQDIMDLTSVAHLSAIKGHVPFMNAFDGFRTSHELQKVELIDLDKVKGLIDNKELEKFRNHGLNLDDPHTFGTSEMDDVYFQNMQARNKNYDKLPDIVNDYMAKISKITGRDYKPFNYYGSPNAKYVVVAMGSVCETIKETIDYLVEKENFEIGLIEVHLYRPFSAKYLLDVLPDTVHDIAVLDRTKEFGANAPLYLDVLSVIKENNLNINVYGGRYGLSSKDTTPADIKSVYDMLGSKDKINGFTISINDDVTNLSLPRSDLMIPSKNYEMVIMGYGSDGMVSASKDIMKITGTGSDAYVQGYFEYDSKKSGGVTKSHLRFGKDVIRSSYYVTNPNTVILTKESYLGKYDILSGIREKGIFILNTTKSKKEVLDILSNKEKNIIKNRKIKFYIVDANAIAKEVGLNNKISSIMEVIIFKICKIIDFDYAYEEIKKSLTKKFENKGGNVLEKNLVAISKCLESFYEVEIGDTLFDEEEETDLSMYELINRRHGNDLPVSAFLKMKDGRTLPSLASEEKRFASPIAPFCNKENCIMCNMCSFVCPHAVIRPYLLNMDEYEKAPDIIKENCQDANIKGEELKFIVAASAPDCTGCGLCEKICPGKKGEKAIKMTDVLTLKKNGMIDALSYLEKNVTEKHPLSPTTIKGSQFIEPKFKFPGACAGCGETPYLKLMSQLFGDSLVVANATGCSSIYSASFPSTTYKAPWANSLFEDNAEFGLGMYTADATIKERIKEILHNKLVDATDEEIDLYERYCAETNDENSVNLYNYVVENKVNDLYELRNFIKKKTIFIVGGDGWAYDIGFSGIDHVLASGANVNILVLDTEVYSNTGGQSSKSTQIGGIAKFAASGKKVNKKDLTKIALTYPNVYVATISLGANMQQAIKAMNEAVAYNGPSIIIAYAPCIAHGIIKGMSNSIDEEKLATESGYFPIFRYNPSIKKFFMDSKADFSKYYEFISGEDRYRTLKQINPEHYNELLEENKNNAERRFEYFDTLGKNSSDENE
jgi:pyruvate-ferredoxin/flavodoxin oxidoreductase